MAEDYLNKTFDSCKNVMMPSTGQHGIELMGCNDLGSKKCTPMQWFSHMGNVNSDEKIPFQINYIPVRSEKSFEGKNPLNMTVVPCSQSVNVS